jgi:hypothetical protein
MERRKMDGYSEEGVFCKDDKIAIIEVLSRFDQRFR